MKLKQLNIHLPNTSHRVTKYNNLMSGFWYVFIYDNEGNQLTLSNGLRKT
jgi:hypothetical protein